MAVQTVLGPIPANTIGLTLPHEHFSMDFEVNYTPAPEHLQSHIDTDSIRLENAGLVRQFPYASMYNVKLCHADARPMVIDDVMLFRKWGGATICENTTYGLKGNLKFSKTVAEETGVNVVAGTGHYTSIFQTASTLQLSVEQLVGMYTDDIVTGIDVGGGERIRCGFVGEIGSNWPMVDFERRAIEATALVQEQIGCGVTFHPGRDPVAPFEIVRRYLEAGGRADKCVMSHLDRTISDVDTVLEFAQLGVYCQYDLFGMEESFFQLKPTVDMPSDAQRINFILKLVEEGHENQVLMSQDIHTKHRLLGFGGHGYAHIINTVLPKLKLRGLTQQQIDQITIKNPGNWLQFKL